MRGVSEDVLATDGRVIGRRAHQTRQKLLDAAIFLMESRGALDVRVVDITRRVGTSPATFYQYFEDVEGAILALCDAAAADAAPITEMLESSWTGRKGLEDAERFVDAFIDYYDEHRAILRVVNLKAEEGDPRFRAARLKTYEVFTTHFAAKLHAGQEAGRVSAELSTMTAAAAMHAMLDRVTAYHVELERRGVDRAEVVGTIARMLVQLTTGKRP